VLRDRLFHITQNNQNVRFATSLAVEDMVITDAIATNQLGIEIFTLNTGRLHSATLEMIKQCESHYQIRIEAALPHDNHVYDFIKEFGMNGF